MEKVKFFRNVLIVVVSFFIVMAIFSWIKNPKTSSPREELPVIVTPTEKVSQEILSEKGVKIFIDSPVENTPVGNPLIIKGRAPGNWFFEASAPITLTDWDGLIIAEGHLNVEGEWMTTDYVPFSAELNYVKPSYGKNGYLIFRKDNPSDDPAHDDSAQMTITF